MSRRNARSKLCPTPSKTGYFTEDEAADAGARFEDQMRRAGRDTSRAFYVYHCDCKRYHLTHHAYGRDRSRNRKASQ